MQISYKQSIGEVAGLLSSNRLKTGWMVNLRLRDVSHDVLASLQDIIWDQGQFKAITIIVTAWGLTILWVPKRLAVFQTLRQTFINVNFVET